MAGCAKLRLRRLDQLILGRNRLMDGVAGGAGQVSCLVSTALPAGMRPAVVTRQARAVDLGRLQRAELFDVPLGVVLNVCLAGAVAALAPERRRRGSRVLRQTVPRMLDALGLLVVAQETRGAAGVPGSGLSRWGCSRGCGRLLRRRLLAGIHESRGSDADKQ